MTDEAKFRFTRGEEQIGVEHDVTESQLMFV